LARKRSEFPGTNIQDRAGRLAASVTARPLVQ
jgi:hypothetical protein